MLSGDIFTLPIDQNYINTSQESIEYSFDATCKEEYYNFILNSFRRSKKRNR